MAYKIKSKKEALPKELPPLSYETSLRILTLMDQVRGELSFNLEESHQFTDDAPGEINDYYWVHFWVKMLLKGSVRDIAVPVDSLKEMDHTIMISYNPSRADERTFSDVIGEFESMTMGDVLHEIIGPEMKEKHFGLGGDAIEVSQVRFRVGDIVRLTYTPEIDTTGIAVMNPDAKWHWLTGDREPATSTTPFVVNAGDELYEILMDRKAKS